VPSLPDIASLFWHLGAAFGLTVSARPSVLSNALAVGVFDLDTCGRRFFLDLSGDLKIKSGRQLRCYSLFAKTGSANKTLTQPKTFHLSFAIVMVES